MTYLTPAQIEQLLRPINPRRVNRDGKGFSHVEAYDVRAHLIRIFGFGNWSAEVTEMTLIYEEPHVDGNRTKWNVGYRACCELSVRDEGGTQLARYSEYAVGDVTNYPARGDAHDMAIKTAESQALKRCATNLGDQFGLSLYDKGSTRALVAKTLVDPRAYLNPKDPDNEVSEHVDNHITELGRENEVEPDNRERSTKPEREARNKPAERAVEDVSLPEVEPDETAAGEDARQYDEAQVAVEAVQDAMPGATVEVDPKAEAVANITQLVVQARATTGDDALQLLKEALELAVKTGTRQHRLSNNETIGASLTAMMAAVAGKR